MSRVTAGAGAQFVRRLNRTRKHQFASELRGTNEPLLPGFRVGIGPFDFHDLDSGHAVKSE